MGLRCNPLNLIRVIPAQERNNMSFSLSQGLWGVPRCNCGDKGSGVLKTRPHKTYLRKFRLRMRL